MHDMNAASINLSYRNVAARCDIRNNLGTAHHLLGFDRIAQEYEPEAALRVNIVAQECGTAACERAVDGCLRRGNLADNGVELAVDLLCAGNGCLAQLTSRDLAAPEALRQADRIVVLDRGRVVESGRAAELGAAGGAFASLLAAS